MATNRKPKRPEPLVNVQFRAAPSVIEAFREIVSREERTLSQDLRRYMNERVAAEEKQAA